MTPTEQISNKFKDHITYAVCETIEGETYVYFVLKKWEGEKFIFNAQTEDIFEENIIDCEEEGGYDTYETVFQQFKNPNNSVYIGNIDFCERNEPVLWGEEVYEYHWRFFGNIDRGITPKEEGYFISTELKEVVLDRWNQLIN